MKLAPNQWLSGLMLIGCLSILLGVSKAQNLPSELTYDDPQPPFYTPAPPPPGQPIDDYWDLAPRQPEEPQPEEPPQVVDQRRAALQEMLVLTNEVRSRNGLPARRLDLGLEQVATSHSAEMLDLNYFSHTSPISSHSTVMKRVRAVGHLSLIHI